MTWHSIAHHIIEKHDMTLHRIAWYDMARHGEAHHMIEKHDMALYRIA